MQYYRNTTIHISIPQWCDKNLSISVSCFAAAEFQFLNGAIKTRGLQSYLCGFTLFQFLNGAIKTCRILLTAMVIPISIPQWCDKNFLLLNALRNCTNISIPQWCDKNYTIFVNLFWFSIFQFLNGAIKTYITVVIRFINKISIPQWCDKNNRCHQVRFLLIQISIPQWCDKNDTATATSSPENKFQFLNGAIKTRL